MTSIKICWRDWVIRGGGSLYFGHHARCAARYRVPWYAQSSQIGFRCAKSADR